MTEISPIDNRYGSEEMREVWTPQNRLDTMVQAEVALMKAQASLGGIIPYAEVHPPKPVIRAEVEFLESKYGHEIVALVAWLEKKTKYRFWHFGATSSDIVDTGMALQFKQAGGILNTRFADLIILAKEKAKRYADLPCLGRTHGQAAVPMTFGHKFAIWADILSRTHFRLINALSQVEIAKMSGAVGNYAIIGGPTVEELVAEELHLHPSKYSTQIVPRDRLANLVCQLGIASSVAELVANELRNLSRYEISEVGEPWTERVGSSTMVQKRNPIKLEKICGLARVVRGHVGTMLENIVTDNERDLRNSSVERVVVPEVFLLVDEQLRTLVSVLKGLEVYTENMADNLVHGGDSIFAEAVLAREIKDGQGRMESYEVLRTMLDNGEFEVSEHDRSKFGRLYREASKGVVDRLVEEYEGK